MSTEPNYYQQFEGLEENSVNIALKPYYGSLPPKYIDCEQPVLCQIQTGKRSRDTTREPLNIAGVIDRSGSMESGDKLVHCLDSVCTLIENMTDKDLFTLIDYDDKIRTHFAGLRKADALAWVEKIKQIGPNGMTNISDGLKAAVSKLTEIECANKRVVFLFSDGNANVGITDLNEMTKLIRQWHQEHQIYISTYGIGSDFNEKWMTSIAKAGKGSYFYIDINDVEKTTDMLRRGFKEFSRQVCSDLKITFTGTGLSLREIRGKRDLETLVEPTKFGNLGENDLVQFFVNVQAQHDVAENILTCYIYYNDTNGHKITKCLELTIPKFSDAKALLTLDPDASLYKTIIDCGEQEKQVTELLIINKCEDAIKLKQQIVDCYEKQNANDRFGLVMQLVTTCKATLKTMQTETDVARVTKVHNYTSNYAVQQCNYANNCCESEDESAGGAGGLFDDDDDDW